MAAFLPQLLADPLVGVHSSQLIRCSSERVRCAAGYVHRRSSGSIMDVGEGHRHAVSRTSSRRHASLRLVTAMFGVGRVLALLALAGLREGMGDLRIMLGRRWSHVSSATFADSAGGYACRLAPGVDALLQPMWLLLGRQRYFSQLSLARNCVIRFASECGYLFSPPLGCACVCVWVRGQTMRQP